MTDLEMFRAWLARAGVETTDRPRQAIEEDPPPRHHVEVPGVSVYVEQYITEGEPDTPSWTYRDVPKVDGYSSFFAVFDFDVDGSLAKIGFYE